MIPLEYQKKAYHQSRAGTGLHPSVHVVENAPGFILDLDVVANVLPVEDSGLSLDVGNILSGLVDLLSSGNRAACLFIASIRRSLAAAEEEDFTLGLGLGDKLDTKKVCKEEESHESKHDTKVAPLVVRGVLVTFAEEGGPVNRAIHSLSEQGKVRPSNSLTIKLSKP
jgi:hypothetical protein